MLCAVGRGEKYAMQNRVECGLKVVEGSVEGLVIGGLMDLRRSSRASSP